MKKAFTMIELVFVIVIAGIISVMIAPSFGGNNLRQAADQVVSHIRYTQHLAMMDNKFDDTNATWFKERWQLAFHKKTIGSDGEWSYSLFNDSSSQDGNPNVSEMAKNPMNSAQYLTGGYSNGTIAYGDSNATPELNLGHEYGIEDIDFIDGCNIVDDRNQRIAFDNIGRPLYDKINNLDSQYMNGATNMLLQTRCKIQLCLTTPCSTALNTNIIEIAIEPETGYTHIL